jgi:choline monooxygenase
MSNGQSNLDVLLSGIGAAAAQPFETGITMPPLSYTSAELLALEHEKIFSTQWICVGRAEEIPTVGDYFTVRVAEEPIVVVRAGARQIRALSNVCRHKWTQLLDGHGNTSRIVCPYHAWTYDLDGALVHTRFMENSGGFDPSKCALPQIECDLWRGFIYVRIDGDDSSLAEQFSGLDARTFDYHMEDMTQICGGEEIWEANWKLLVENFTETYHVFHTHRDSIAKYSPTELTMIMDGDAAHSFGVNPLFKDAMEESPFEPHHPELSDKHQEEFCMIGLFPAQMIALAPDRIFYMCLTPLGPDRLHSKWGVACYDHNLSTEAAAGIEGIYQTINAEDRIRLERVQTSLKSRFARSGPISQYEKLNWEFTRYLSRLLNGVR